jgi:GMP synthase (glutamine-hydrolysing)
MMLIVDCGSSKTPQIVSAFEEFCDTKSIGFHDLTEEMAIDCIGIVFSGAPLLITDIDMSKYLEHVRWLKSFQKPILGICFGHQLLGLLWGAKGAKMREDRDWQEIEIIEESPLFNRLPDCFEMMEDHCEHITIPPEFKLMAASDACINECMQHETKPIFGVQFHPEVSGNYGNILLENFYFICEK